ncbi:MAG: YbaB/EbfC family nucleoid-associated protein [Nitrospirae bacterium]|nr:YbaB/EbfC family nucleoid-associated protein [Nitrospirota bacterium]
MSNERSVDMRQLLGQFQSAQARLKGVQERLAGRQLSVQTGGGLVEVVINGRFEIVSLRVDPELVRGGDSTLMRELIVSGVNEAIRRCQQMIGEEVSREAAGIVLGAGPSEA